jgi:hypothetical protein
MRFRSAKVGSEKTIGVALGLADGSELVSGRGLCGNAQRPAIIAIIAIANPWILEQKTGRRISESRAGSHDGKSLLPERSPRLV